MPWLQKSRPDSRNAVLKARLESAISEAIKRECEGFVGVVVRRVQPKTRDAPDWDVCGILYGKADRQKAETVLATVLERMQREFSLADEEPVQPPPPKSTAAIPIARV